MSGADPFAQADALNRDAALAHQLQALERMRSAQRDSRAPDDLDLFNPNRRGAADLFNPES